VDGRTLALVAVVVGWCGLLGACVGGLGKRATDQSPLRLSDAASGRAIGECLVVGLYDRNAGIGTLRGEGPGVSTPNKFIAHPFIYRAGERFRPVEGGGGGIGLPFGIAGAGRGWAIHGVVVIGRGFRPRYLGELWERSQGPTDELKLTRVSAGEWSEYARRLSLAVGGESIRAGDLEALLDLNENERPRVEFTDADRRLVREFLAK
jgi:hypothetical protein